MFLCEKLKRFSTKITINRRNHRSSPPSAQTKISFHQKCRKASIARDFCRFFRIFRDDYFLRRKIHEARGVKINVRATFRRVFFAASENPFEKTKRAATCERGFFQISLACRSRANPHFFRSAELQGGKRAFFQCDFLFIRKSQHRIHFGINFAGSFRQRKSFYQKIRAFAQTHIEKNFVEIFHRGNSESQKIIRAQTAPCSERIQNRSVQIENRARKIPRHFYEIVKQFSRPFL